MGWRRSLEPAVAGTASTRAPDYGEPLRAWRMWEVEDLDRSPRLRSLYRICFWPVGVPFEARCEAHRFRLRRRARHDAPTETCTCGVYAVPFQLIRKFALRDGLPPGRSLAIGTVSLWGEVIECERGWRAQFAYPSRIFMPHVSPHAEEYAAGLEDYRVPVELLDTSSVVDALDEVGELAACRLPPPQRGEWAAG
jgi:hypothetical protein